MSNTHYALRNTLPETIRAALDRHSLIPDNTNVVLGVSGGADSVALLHAFHRLGIPCTVAHLNHSLRGAASDADEQFVRNLADQLGIPLVTKSANVQELAEASGLSVEMAARQARHTFFSEFQNSVIALAHHADDQVETFILKLARGAGTQGLGGMAFSQKVGPIQLIRPMLEISRSEIIDWLQENRLDWREDASNTDEMFMRNRVRQTVLPMLEQELNPGIRETILRTMDILREENIWMEQLEPGDLTFGPGTPIAAKRRALRNWLFDNGATEAGFDAVEQILSLMDSGEGSTTFELSNKQRVVVEYGQPRFETDDCQSPVPEWTLIIEDGTGWRKDHGKGAGILPAEASFGAEKVGGSAIEVRTLEAGDRMAPFGMAGTRKLQDILTDQKIPKTKRRQIPIVVCRGEIIWIPGYRITRGWEVQHGDEKSIHVRIEQNRTE